MSQPEPVGPDPRAAHASHGSPRLMIIGAGIAGLVCAYRLHRLLPRARLTVLEAGDHVGGKIRTTEIAGMAIDEAADAFLARVPAAIELCTELGLHEQLVTPAQRQAFVWRAGRLHRFPAGLVLGVPTDLEALAASGVVSGAGVDRAAEDLVLPRDLPGAPPAGEDESVGALVRRRLGDEVMDALVGPLLSGVNAGDADALSIAGGAPQFAAAVADQPSLIAGLRAQRAAALAASDDPDAPIFYGLRGGTQTLTDALAAALPAGSVHTGQTVTAIDRQPDGTVEITTANGSSFGADAVVLALPTFAAAPLVAGYDDALADLAAELAGLEWASVILVTFAVPRSSISHPLDGSGFLVAPGDGLLMTACSFGSSKWAHWRRGGTDPTRPPTSLPTDPPPATGESDQSATDQSDLVILRVSAGRHGDPRAWAMTDDEVVATLTDELATTIGLRGPVTEVRVSRWERALPQYRPGHLDQARRWKATARDEGLHVIGAGYLGLGIPALITDATATAAAIAKELGGTRP